VDKAVVVRHPLQWIILRLQDIARAVPERRLAQVAMPAPNRIAVGDLWAALAAGWSDFLAFRSDVIFLCILYPLTGLVLWRFARGNDLIQLAFPLAAGFAIVGPLFATGLYEMSRERERGLPVTWATSFAALRSPAIFGILAVGGMLLAIFAAWLAAADLIYLASVAAERPGSFSDFVHDVVATRRGTAMTLVGIGVGFGFAAVALCVSVVAFPLLLDRQVGAVDAVRASVRAVRANPFEMAVWGGVVAAGLVVGSAPFLIGLIVVLPVLGHATWHLYRRVMPTTG
jgi:uncharacterized membrane protein